MNSENIKTPGVYVNELNSFPNSVVPVATAVPVFVGYTPQASYEGKSYENVPTKISSFSDFSAIYCLPNTAASSESVKQYNPQYYVVAGKTQPIGGDYIHVGATYYSIVPDPNTIYYLYNSIKLFYENGGGDAYIVSVGSYGAPSRKPTVVGKQIVNPNVKLKDLKGGVASLKNEEEPTMYICPEATLLSISENGLLMQEMLKQNAEMQTAISIFDIIGGRNPDSKDYTSNIEDFRKNIGTNGLNFGTAYYPFVGTTIMETSEIDYTNLFGGDLKQLKNILSPSSAPNSKVETILANIENAAGTRLSIGQYNNALIATSTVYSSIMNHVLNDVNMLPPSGALAGVITVTDNEVGPWQAPANKSIKGVTKLPIKLSSSQQENLNVDAISGKSINAIKLFNGAGILIWGARTLDGNSQDWRYLSVRRTVTYIEQSCKLAAHAFVFEPNTRSTWGGVTSMITGFLYRLWKDGALKGASPADAFKIECGMGTTMTKEDLLKGIMKFKVKIAVVRPSEFIVLSFEQQMAKLE